MVPTPSSSYRSEISANPTQLVTRGASSDGSQSLPAWPATDFRLFCYRTSALAMVFLKRHRHVIPFLEKRCRNSVDMPVGLMLELAAFLQLVLWELLGFRNLLPQDLPDVGAALKYLRDRMQSDDPPEPDNSPLMTRIITVWFRHFAWSGQEEMRADFFLGDANDDEIIDAFAKFVWEHRHKGRTDNNQHRGCHEKTTG